MFHDRRANFACLRPVLSLTNSVVVQYTATTQAVRGLAAFVATSLHMLPKDDHLRAKLDGTIWTDATLASVAKQDEPLLLLPNHLLLLCLGKSISIIAVTTDLAQFTSLVERQLGIDSRDTRGLRWDLLLLELLL